MIEFPESSEIHHWIDTPTRLGTLVYAGFFVTYEDWGLRAMRALDFFLFALLLDDEGAFRDSKGLEIRLKAGDLILVEAGYRHQYDCVTGGNWSEIYVCFKGGAF